MTFYRGKPCNNCGNTRRYKSNDTCVKCAREASKRRAKQFPEKNRADSLRWYYNNKQKVIETNRRWRRNNPQKEAAMKNRRRAAKAKADGDYTSAEFKRLCDKYDNCCLRCGRADVELTADHVIPLSEGGSNDIGNIQPLCLKCNSSKGAKKTDYRKRGSIRRWIQRRLF